MPADQGTLDADAVAILDDSAIGGEGARLRLDEETGVAPEIPNL